jgi:hypothetical protein
MSYADYKARPNACKWDLGDYLAWYEEARQTAFVRFQLAPRNFPEGEIVNITQYYVADCKFKGKSPDKEFYLKCVYHYCDRGMFTISNLAGMLDGTKPLEFKKAATTSVNERPAQYNNRSNYSGNLRNLLSQEMIQQPSQSAIPAIPRDDDGPKKFTRQMAIDWMIKYQPENLERWEEYFNYYGIAPGKGEIYILK